jgi:hypothetical protein
MNLSNKIRSYPHFYRMSFTFSVSDPDPDFQLGLHSNGSRSWNAKRTYNKKKNIHVFNSVADPHHFDADADTDPSFQLKV